MMLVINVEQNFLFYLNNIAINSIYDKFINNIDQNLYICCLFLDLIEAFDTIVHDILLYKLCHKFKIMGKPLDSLTSDLNTRYEYTNVSNFMSLYTKASCGIS